MDLVNLNYSLEVTGGLKCIWIKGDCLARTEGCTVLIATHLICNHIKKTVIQIQNWLAISRPIVYSVYIHANICIILLLTV